MMVEVRVRVKGYGWGLVMSRGELLDVSQQSDQCTVWLGQSLRLELRVEGLVRLELEVSEWSDRRT